MTTAEKNAQLAELYRLQGIALMNNNPAAATAFGSSIAALQTVVPTDAAPAPAQPSN